MAIDAETPLDAVPARELSPPGGLGLLLHATESPDQSYSQDAAPRGDGSPPIDAALAADGLTSEMDMESPLMQAR